MDGEWVMHCTHAHSWSTARGDDECWQEASSSNETATVHGPQGPQPGHALRPHHSSAVFGSVIKLQTPMQRHRAIF